MKSSNNNKEKLYYLPLSNSDKKTLVDKDIYLKYKDAHLYLRNLDYVMISLNGCRQRLHRVIMGFDPDYAMLVDHINGNPLDNRRCNLRPAYSIQNSANCITKRNCGVHITKKGKYRSSIAYNGKTYGLGNFNSEFEALLVRDKASLYFYGEFAVLNFSNKIHLHKKLHVKYVDYDKVPLLSEEELENRQQERYRKVLKNLHDKRQIRKEFAKSSIKKVINKKIRKSVKNNSA